MQLFIKNMVCERCIMTVRRELEGLGISTQTVQLGEVETSGTPSPSQLAKLKERLCAVGFEVLDDKRSRTIEKIKNTIITLVHRSDGEQMNVKLSAFLEQKLQRDYHYLTTLFSSVEGVTIEKYVILQRVERIKEMLMYDELTLSEIAWQMGYSSVQHLSQQFKKTTGLTPSSFRQLKEKNRKPLDKL